MDTQRPAFEWKAKELAGTDNLILMSHRGRNSAVWLGPANRVYKHSPKFLIDNELYFLERMAGTGYVPEPVVRLHDELILMPFIPNERITRPDEFMEHLEWVLFALANANCRHGDLTEYSVIVNMNRPVIIDFGESRTFDSPLPDKRREGDRYWLTKTMNFLVKTKGIQVDLGA